MHAHTCTFLNCVLTYKFIIRHINSVTILKKKFNAQLVIVKVTKVVWFKHKHTKLLLLLQRKNSCKEGNYGNLEIVRKCFFQQHILYLDIVWPKHIHHHDTCKIAYAYYHGTLPINLNHLFHLNRLNHSHNNRKFATFNVYTSLQLI